VTVINSNLIFLAGSTNIQNQIVYMGGVTNLTDIDDVDAPAPSANDALIWDGNKWTNAPQTGSGGDLTTLSNDVLGAWATASNAFDLAVIASNLAAVAETDPVWASWLSTNIPFAYAPVYDIPIDNGTATVYLTRGRYQRIIPTNVVEVSVEFNSKPTADFVGSLLLSINVTTALVTFATQYISEATASNITIATEGTVPTSLILYSAASRTNEWGIYQLEP